MCDSDVFRFSMLSVFVPEQLCICQMYGHRHRGSTTYYVCSVIVIV